MHICIYAYIYNYNTYRHRPILRVETDVYNESGAVTKRTIFSQVYSLMFI